MDFRLKVFRSVAENLSFTKASQQMHISQPAVSKHIAELEQQYRVPLFERLGGHISLTQEGRAMLSRVESILDEYDRLAYDMELMRGNFAGELRIGASSTIAHYLLSPIVADFVARFPQIKFHISSGNSTQIESMLENHSIDVALVEGGAKRQNLRYTTFAKDELVVVTSADNDGADSLYIEEGAASSSSNSALLCNVPLVLREIGSGTLDVIARALKSYDIDFASLNVVMQIASTEGIKRYLQACTSNYAIISVISIIDELKSHKLKIVDLYGIDIERDFSLVVRRGGNSDMADRFMNFVQYWCSEHGL